MGKHRQVTQARFLLTAVMAAIPVLKPAASSAVSAASDVWNLQMAGREKLCCILLTTSFSCLRITAGKCCNEEKVKMVSMNAYGGAGVREQASCVLLATIVEVLTHGVACLCHLVPQTPDWLASRLNRMNSK